MLRATWESGRSFNKSKTEQLAIKAMEESPTVKVTSVVTKDKKQGRPVPLNTVNLLKACSSALGIGPHAAMQAAERLYLNGYLSYPRTESTAYPNSFDIKGTLQQQAGDSRWGANVRNLLTSGSPTKSRGGVDMGDHPPITPCRSAGSHELSGDMGRIYEFVVRHFIASVSEDAVWRSTKVGFEIEALGPKGNFFISGKQVRIERLLRSGMGQCCIYTNFQFYSN
jgi:DNA topoisomerase-3